MWNRVTDWWIPAELLKTVEGRWRARLLVQVLMTGAAITLSMLGLYLLRGVEQLVVQTGGIATVLVGCLFALRARAPLSLVVNVGLLVVMLAFTLTPLVEGHFDGAAISWFCIIPFLAVLLDRPRASAWWVPLVLGAMLFLYFSPEHGPAWSEAARFATLARSLGLVVTVLVFALAFHRAQAEAREELAQANAAKSRFLANMSHELRTPMNGVLGMVEVMLLRPHDAQLAADLEIVRQSGRTMVSLVNGILDLSKIEAGKFTLEAQPFSLEALLVDVARLYTPLAEQRGLRFAVERAPGLRADVQGDGLRLRQVLGNLIDNAIKFTSQGEVRLRVSSRDFWVRFELEDTGPGIAPEVAQRLFAPFEQADSSTTRRYGGSGLGLALSRQLVELMRGQLELHSTPGQGTRFWFELPLPAAEHVEPVSAHVTPAGRGRVLVVDDNPINLKVASALVRAAGYEVGNAVNGLLALEAVQRESWDAVLMDCHMPEMDGYEATRRIRQLEGARGQVPIIALTAAVMADELAACRTAGMNDCLTKPLNLEALKRALAATHATA